MPYYPFVEERIADGEIVKNSTGGPVFSTQVSKSFSGQEQRNVNWDSALWQGEIGERTFTRGQMDTLTAFFRARRGRAIGFRHKDQSDYSATKAQGVLVPQPAPAHTYRLYKAYVTPTGDGELRKISKPCAGTVNIYAVGTTGALGCTVDYATGTVTLPGAPTGALSWTGEFDVPVRFDTDALKSQFIAIDRASGQALFQVFSLPIVELKDA